MIAAHGLAVRPPRGWDVRIFRRPPNPPESTYALLHAATFALPGDVDDYGDGGVQLMSGRDVFVALVEFDPAAVATALFARRGFPSRISANEIRPTGVQRQIAEQAGVQRFFSAGGRAWCLYVVVGSYADRRALVPRANELIGAIEVASK